MVRFEKAEGTLTKLSCGLGCFILFFKLRRNNKHILAPETTLTVTAFICIVI